MNLKYTDRTHLSLLSARTYARQDYPKGDPRRLVAERAAKASQRTHRLMEDSGGQRDMEGAVWLPPVN
jgi:hypothetical protein